MVDLLRRDIVDGSPGGDVQDITGIAGLVASNVARGGVLDALLGVDILGLSGCPPVLLFGFAVHHETWESIYRKLVWHRRRPRRRHTVSLRSCCGQEQTCEEMHSDGWC